MGHYARVDQNNIVQEVVTAHLDVVESGELGDPAAWIKTSYNTRGGVHYEPNSSDPSPDQSKSLRKNYAGVGFTYDPILDAFIPPKPFPSWVLDEQTCLWNAPIPYPGDLTHPYLWDEDTESWVPGPIPEGD